MELSEFELLLQKILHNSASPEEEELVLQSLRESEDHRRVYCEHTRLEALLHMRSLGIKALLTPTPVVPLDVMQKSQKKKMIQWISVSTIAALLMIGLFLTFFLNPPSPGLDFKTSPHTKYTLTHLKESEVATTRMEKGSTLTVQSGAVELEFGSGVRSLVEAPASITLLKDDHLRIDYGKAWFTVPSEAIGFKVTTPEIEVIDLGTEFAITSTLQHEDECHVIKGKVSVTALKGMNHSMTLSAGNAVKNTFAGRLKSIEVREADYLKSLPTQPLHLHWSFDAIENGEFTTESSFKSYQYIQNTLHSKQSIQKAQARGKYGNALQFAEMTDFMSSDWMGISGSQARTVAFWIKFSPEDTAPIISLLGWGKRESVTDKQTCFLFFTRAKQSNTKAIGLTTNNYQATIRKHPVSNEWVHFTCVYHGELDENGIPKLSFYLNGELEPHSHFDYSNGSADFKIDTVIDHPLSKPFTIGSSLFSNGIKGIAKKTMLDELHIIAKPLNENEVKFLYLNNKIKK